MGFYEQMCNFQNQCKDVSSKGTWQHLRERIFDPLNNRLISSDKNFSNKQTKQYLQKSCLTHSSD